MMQNKNKTVVKSMALLNLFLHKPSLTLSELVSLTGMPKTSVHRMVSSLEEMGFLSRDASGAYSLGLVFLEFGQLVADRLDIRKIAKPVMEELCREVDEAVQLIMRDGNEAIYVEKIEGTQTVRLYTAIGRRSPLYAGACARSILSFLPREEIEAYIKQTELISIGSGTITDPEKLLQEIDASVQNGYTVSYSELENYTAAIGAPIFNHERQVAAGISIAGFEARFTEDRLPYLTEKVKDAALQISRKIGYT
ncbi:HTH-type transcriptional regulator KipR [Bacillus subtilis]|jgi:IclR family KDG regulon transcriptional repressor|nr:Transcriptional regulator (IclR family) [Bacillus subtilis QB928]AIC38790.1 IclR family transcriptional regulator [Bacillus subtilis subsp. subtilis str. JH642 substr. AG174]AIC43022.1 IclR family transcriptional regulator [Bacillus subtilis subsp. subtilis str. AG1839]AOL96218.1 HTH-type transcriptional regulator KipR [Bacillus subtilis]AQR80352.1 HTH-type transcriptional regulator KipR [Bacillus subtilis subsp. subtilis str. 168]EHA28956.1 IclR family transcriptional regulator [Bacillus s